MWGDVMTLSFSPDGSRFYLGGNTATQSLYVLNTSGIVVRTDSLGAPQYGAISIDNDGNVFSYLVAILSQSLILGRFVGEFNQMKIIM